MRLLRSLGGWVAPALLGAIAVVGSFEPTQDDAPGVLAQRVLGLAAVPQPAQSAVCAVLGLAAVLVALRGPRLLWPVLVVAALAWLLRSGGPLVFVASYCVAERHRRLGPLLGYVVVAVVVTLVPPVAAPAPDTDGAVAVQSALGAVALFVVLPVVLGQWIGSRRRELEGLRARADQHEREREIRTAQARAEERTRIARDMHDVLAHRVSLMVLYAGALEINAADPAAAERAGLIRETGRQALEQLREVLGVLRDPEDDGDTAPLPGRAELPALLDASRAAGVQVGFRDLGEPRELTPAAGHAVYRVVREGLTNAHKHAGGAPVDVQLRYTADEVEVTVRNAPALAPTLAGIALPGSGSGLLGLRERVELLGGGFTAHDEPGGGFVVRAHLPSGSAGTCRDGEEDTR